MGAPAAVPEEVAARRQRFIEGGGIEPTSAADRALFEALLASGSFLPDLLLADVSELGRLAADPWLRRAKPPDVIGREVRAAAAGLSGGVSAAREHPAAAGMVFRVDLRLRPEGRNGPLCNSIAAAETYYETFGRTWERQAWLRARPAAGDRDLGEELLAVLEPFIYPRSVDARLIDEVRALRALFRD